MLVFLKLGGSLITDKATPYTPRLDLLADLAGQIAAACRENPDLRLVLGHGSGSFGHQAASHYGTRQGVAGPAAWCGFAEVWYQAAALNRLVIEALRAAGLAAVALAPVAAVTARGGRIRAWNLTPLRAALAGGLLPVIYGDVAFDLRLGGTILSTEDLFAHLAPRLRPRRILLAGQEAGVWADYPARTRLLAEITPRSLSGQTGALGAAAGADVTGGMESKVRQMMALIRRLPGLEVLIFSGEGGENVRRALQGENPGTLLHR
ncbi:MAG: isopentenyl phosphate kinase [Anaerolineales bacterium]